MTHCALNYSLIHRSEVVVQVARRPQMELLNRGRLAVVHHNDQPGPKRTCLIHPTATRGRSDLSEVCVLHLVVWRHTEVVEPIQCASRQHTHGGTRRFNFSKKFRTRTYLGAVAVDTASCW